MLSESEIGIICIGNSRTGKSQILTTSQTNFFPKNSARGADTQKAIKQKYITDINTVWLIDTPGLYEIDQSRLEENVKEVTKGLQMMSSVKVCFVGRSNSGNMNIQDHAVIARISECLRGLSNNKKEIGVIATIIINHVNEWEFDDYMDVENIKKIFATMHDSVKYFKGQLFVEQVIMIESMNPLLLKEKTDSLINFINKNTSPNKLKFISKLKAEKNDVALLTKVITGVVSGVTSFGAGIVAGNMVNSAIVSASAPFVALGAVTILGTIGLYTGVMSYINTNKDEASIKSLNNNIKVYTLRKNDKEPQLTNLRQDL